MTSRKKTRYNYGNEEDYSIIHGVSINKSREINVKTTFKKVDQKDKEMPHDHAIRISLS